MNVEVGVIGAGFVGAAVARGLTEWADVKIHDVLPERSTSSLKDAINSDFVFICVPTPEDHATGECDLSYIRNVLNEIQESIGWLRSSTAICIKSTVPPGTTQQLCDEFPQLARHLLHVPEFLTARCALVDFQTPARLIIGIPMSSSSKAESLLTFYEKRFPGVQVMIVSSLESELIKYFVNAFFACKVAYFNEIRLIADAAGADWQRVLGGVLSDGRIAHAHTNVPGPDGKRGFGGTCLPKDTQALIKLAESYGIEPFVMMGALLTNKNVRGTNDQISREKHAWQPPLSLAQEGV